MPELPDLEVFKSNIYARLSSKRLIGLNVYNLNKVNYPEAILNGELAGKELLSVDRAGRQRAAER